MALNRAAGAGALALTALAFGFLAATQLRSQLLNPSNRVERNQALVRSVQDLERINGADRKRVTELRAEIGDLEAQAARRSDTNRRLADELFALRVRAGLTALRGPGVTILLANGRPAPDAEGKTAYLVNFQDVQDVVNLLYQGGAEGVAVNGHRLSPLSGLRGTAGTVVIDQGPPAASPFRIAAIGNRGQMEQLLGEPAQLGDLRLRQRRFGLQLEVAGGPDIQLPGFDSSLRLGAARAG